MNNVAAHRSFKFTRIKLDQIVMWRGRYRRRHLPLIRVQSTPINARARHPQQ